MTSARLPERIRTLSQMPDYLRRVADDLAAALAKVPLPDRGPDGG